MSHTKEDQARVKADRIKAAAEAALADVRRRSEFVHGPRAAKKGKS